MRPLVIAGPTASGKSKLALRLAAKFNGEIICADSRQFYAGMAIGTACPSNEEQAMIPHHGYGMLDPQSQRMDAGCFVKFAREKIDEINKRGKRPILVGGGGLYLRALRYGLNDVPPSDKNVAQALKSQVKILGVNHLYNELKRIDEDTAHLIKPEDSYRITRALEIFRITNEKPSQLRQSFFSDVVSLGAHWVYKKPDKAALLLTLTRRAQEMFDGGLIDEAANLRERLPADHWVLSVMGYQEALQLVDKKLSKDQAIERTVIRHRQYAKRQYTWFNKEKFYRIINST